MSNRTSQADRAVRLAWKNEQQLVGEGKGTRDWTPEQQNDILTDGVAKDENGVVFRGHHMQSVELFPQYQGEPGNIQFLSAEEHLKAHDGWFRNLTNWYYNPVTGEKEPFEDDIFKPCKIIYLSVPVCPSKPIFEETVESTGGKPEDKKTEHRNNKGGSASIPVTSKPNQTQKEPVLEPPPASAGTNAVPEQDTDIHIPQHIDEGLEGLEGFEDIDELEDLEDLDLPDYLLEHYSEEPRRGIIGRIRDKYDEFRDEHPIAAGIIEGLGHFAEGLGKEFVGATIDSMMEDAYSSFDREPGNNNPRHADNDSAPSVSIDIPDEDSSGSKRASPREHTVNDPGQHYWKGGERVWIPKKPYRRGGKKNDETEDD